MQCQQGAGPRPGDGWCTPGAGCPATPATSATQPTATPFWCPRYSKAYEYYKQAQASYWTTEEVDLSQDMRDWDKLTGARAPPPNALRSLQGGLAPLARAPH